MGHRAGAGAVEHLHVDHVPVEGHPRQAGFTRHGQAGSRLLSRAQVSELVGAQFAHRLRPGLQVRFRLHVAELLRQSVLYRRVDGLGCRIVAGGDGQTAENALPRLIQRCDGAGHGCFPGGLVAGSAALRAFGTVRSAFPAGLSDLGSAADLGVGDPTGERLLRGGQVD